MKSFHTTKTTYTGGKTMLNAKFDKLYALAVDDLTKNLLPWWMQYTVDEENGGFYGAVGNNNVADAKHSKFITLNARLIWTSTATPLPSMVFPNTAAPPATKKPCALLWKRATAWKNMSTIPNTRAFTRAPAPTGRSIRGARA